MRYVSFYLLVALRGNSSLRAKEIKKILNSIGIEADNDQLNKVIRELNRKNTEESLPRILTSWPVCLLVGLWLSLLPQDLQHLLQVLLQPQQRRRRRRRRKSQSSQMTTLGLACLTRVPLLQIKSFLCKKKKANCALLFPTLCSYLRYLQEVLTHSMYTIVVVWSLSCVWLFVTPPGSSVHGISETRILYCYLEKEKQSWRNQAPWLQVILQSYSHQNSMVLAQKQTNRSMEQDRKPRDKSTHPWSPDLW